MNFLIFINSLSCGGAERVTVNLANHWAEKDWHVTIVTLASCELDFYPLHPSIQRIALESDGHSDNILRALVNNLRNIMVLRRLLRDRKPDISLAMMPAANVLLAMATLGNPRLVTIGSERTHPPQSPLGKPWEGLRRSWYCRLSALVALSDESRAWLLKYTKAQKVVVIPNAAIYPLSPEPLRGVGHRFRTHGRRILLSVGRLTKQKGFEQLISSFATLARSHANWDLIILGEGEERTALEAQIAGTDLTRRIKLPGRVNNVSEWYAIADLFVLSSRFEGFPNVLVEAMAHGVPAVSFDCLTGPRYIIRHEIDGLLISPENYSALSTALSRLMGDEGLRLRFAHRAIDVRERFSPERIITLWETLFEECRIEAKKSHSIDIIN